jgi:hypothetical protein
MGTPHFKCIRKCCQLLLQNQPGDPKWVDDIKKDLHRNFPTHELFGGAYEKIGQKELFRVLKAYTVLNPVDGYCQAQARMGFIDGVCPWDGLRMDLKSLSVKDIFTLLWTYLNKMIAISMCKS